MYGEFLFSETVVICMCNIGDLSHDPDHSFIIIVYTTLILIYHTSCNFVRFLCEKILIT